MPGRKKTDEEIRKVIADTREMIRKRYGGMDSAGNVLIDFTDCMVWFDENGYTVVDRYGPARSGKRFSYRCEGDV